MATWTQLTERSSSDFFNGEEVVRFDYGASIAYVSVAFDASGDDIYLRIVNASGQPVTAEFQSICRYYDNRRAPVVITADDLGDDGYSDFTTAIQTLRSYHLPVTLGIITGQCTAPTWSQVQQELNLGGVEAASHSRTHAALPYPDPAAEIMGSREEILTNLTLPPLFRRGSTEYVYPYFYAYGGAIVFDSLVAQAGYLVGRVASGSYGDFVPWDTVTQKYGATG